MAACAQEKRSIGNRGRSEIGRLRLLEEGLCLSPQYLAHRLGESCSRRRVRTPFPAALSTERFASPALISNLVEENRSAIRCLETSDAPLQCTRKGAFLMTE